MIKRISVIAIFIFSSISTITQIYKIPLVNNLVLDGSNNLFDEAVNIIKEKEGWHTEKQFPYVGYGHKLVPKDTFNCNITEEFADKLLRKDLLQKCAVFREFGQDSILLGTLAYNVGEYNILGTKNKPTSKLIIKLKSGNRDIYKEYVSFCRYKDKVIPSLVRRRQLEFERLYKK